MDRFWSKVKKSDGCWEWDAGKFPEGYGAFNLGGKPVKAHRLSYELAFGPIGKGLMVCHKCDNRGCVNPEHLFLGTAADNNWDMRRKGRQNSPGRWKKSVCHTTWHTTKVSELMVQRIRLLRGVFGPAELSRMTGINRKNIQSILSGRTWRFLGTKQALSL